MERVLDRVRISVILIDAEKEEQAWAGSYDRDLTAANWFDIRNEISGVITDKLQEDDATVYALQGRTEAALAALR